MPTKHPFLLYPSRTYTWHSEQTYEGTRETYQKQYQDWLEEVESVKEVLASDGAQYDTIRRAILVGWVTYRWAEVKECLAALLEFRPTEADLLFYLGEISWFALPNESQHAQDYYQAYLATEPIAASPTSYFLDGWYIERHEYAPCQLLAFTRLAEIAKAEEKPKLAEKHYQAAIECAPSTALAPYGALARLLGSAGRVEEAFSLLQQGLANYEATEWDRRPFDLPCEYYEELEAWQQATFRYTYRYYELGFLHYAEDAVYLFEQGIYNSLAPELLAPIAQWAIELMQSQQKSSPAVYQKSSYRENRIRNQGYYVYGDLLARSAHGFISLGAKDTAWQMLDLLMSWSDKHSQLPALIALLEE
ncbi:MAG: tetratricopeptide repeat protein [Bacteroidota bacterium]